MIIALTFSVSVSNIPSVNFSYIFAGQVTKATVNLSAKSPSMIFCQLQIKIVAITITKLPEVCRFSTT